MARYDLECKECGKVFEADAAIEDRHTVRCPECNGETEVLITVVPPKHQSWSKWNIGS